MIQSSTLKRIKIRKICPKCGTEFEINRNVSRDGTEKIKSFEKKYCNRKCANGHVHTEEWNKKISKGTKGITSHNKGKSKVGKNYIKIDKKKYYCSSCKKEMNYKTKTGKCKKCMYENTEPMRKYRHLCSFKFNLFNYPEEFDLELLKIFGFYSASNRGNNSEGISRDHLVSIKFGFDNNVPVEIMSHPANCGLISQRKNASKRSKNSITLEELYDRIDIWNEKY